MKAVLDYLLRSVQSVHNFLLIDEPKLKPLNALFGSIVFRPLARFFEITVFYINIQIRLGKLLTVGFPFRFLIEDSKTNVESVPSAL